MYLCAYSWKYFSLLSDIGGIVSLQQSPAAMAPFIPLLLKGWGLFPSEDIPSNLSWGHTYVYLVESSPSWTSAMVDPLSDSDEELLSQEGAVTLGQTNILRKGIRFLSCDNVKDGRIMDVLHNGYYFVKAKIEASMRSNAYFTTITMTAVSGSIRDGTCNCHQPSLGRCCHVAALLLFISKHIETNGYGGKFNLIMKQLCTMTVNIITGGITQERAVRMQE